jgi:alpha-methylacyl-CoA racemase
MGVLSGIRVLEFDAIGPGPFGAMLLSDMGADVLRIDHPQAPDDLGPKTTGKRVNVTGRGRRCVPSRPPSRRSSSSGRRCR